jgi:hypothetical protein
MLAVVLCLPILLIVTSGCLAGSLRHQAASCRSPGQQRMPNLSTSVLRSSPRVSAAGRAIKGLYYSQRSTSLHSAVAFHVACDRHLEPLPFLVVDFDLGQFFLDVDRDGCADASGLFVSAVDPADFYAAIDGAKDLCYEEPVSVIRRHWVKSGVP